MYANFLLILSACFSSGVTSYGRWRSKDYDLINLIFQKYKQYKRDHSTSFDEYDNFKRQKILPDKKENFKQNIRIMNTYSTDVKKRNNILVRHAVTPIHEDDDVDEAEKRGLAKALHDGVPKVDPISPVHDDEEGTMLKHSVAIHDDIDLSANPLYNHKDISNNIPDDSKTFITVVENRGSTLDDANIYDKNVNIIDDRDTDDDDSDGKDIFGSEGIFHINAKNNLKEEGVLEAAGKSKKKGSTKELRTIAMPHVSPQKMDTYLCYAHKLPEDDRYIVEYRPLAEKQIAHHMLLFGCDEPFKEKGYWNCREMQPVCNGERQSIMYAWAKNAPALKMPTNVGFHVGGDSGFNYLVLQVHYLHVDKFKNGSTDNSGIKFVLDKNKKRYLAGIQLLANGWNPIPPHRKRAYIDMGCHYPDGATFFPFRFRVHAHKLGVVITGYRVRHNNWTLIGRGDPQRPQAFYAVFNDIDIQPGDTLMGRCTYNSTSRNTETNIGATHSDEMCNFYIMYFYDSQRYHDGPGICNGVTMHSKPSLFKSFPNNSDIPLATMEEANRLNFARKGLADMAYSTVHKWPKDGMTDGELPLTVGQITGVDITNDQREVVILHRGERSWGQRTFDAGDRLRHDYRETIKVNTLVWLDKETGAIKRANGSDLFYLPHGITIDGKGNIWITDVGAHQVYKLSPEMKVLLTLGEKFTPGRAGPDHFCKPTDVAVMENGDFFVSDGYCNSRVVKFDKDGKMLLQISDDTHPNFGSFPGGKQMVVVHSVSLDPVGRRLFVADRENGRILIFNSISGIFLKEINVDDGAVYALEYNMNQGGVLHFVTGPLEDHPVTISGYTYSLILNSTVSKWAPEGGLNMPHDLAVTKDNQNAFVAEISPFKIWKFTRHMKSRP